MSHQAAFAALDALRAADTGSTGLNNTSSASHLFGGMNRRGDPARTDQTPWIEVEFVGEREQDAAGAESQRIDIVVRFHIFTKRDTLYSTLAGNQDSVVQRVRIVYHKIQPPQQNLSSFAWSFNRMYRVGGQQAQDDGNHAHYVETYLMRMTQAVVA